MHEKVQPLEANLRRQLGIYQDLLAMAGEKQEALVANDLKNLERIVAGEEQLILQAAQLEQERLELAGEAAQQMQLPVEELTLGKLGENYVQFNSIQEELETVIAAIRQKQSSNQKLIEQAMKVIDFSLSLMTQYDETTYTRLLQRAESPGPGFRGSNRVHIIDKSV
ncbi:FlgN protein [Peptococcaceae bacterium CEB3]|nr:FlgN protein [Peptococcaceae bacterium CEB3]